MFTKSLRFFILISLAVVLIVSAVVTPIAQAATIDPYEIDSLLYVREEEKLARDTYLTLYDVWGMSIFQTIAASEQNHMDSVKGLLDKYGIQDPALPEIGVFQNDFLQSKFFELVAWGKQSKADALLVGCFIEEIDIVDLATRMASIDNPDILNVFQNLMDGSENHLRAFVSNYESLTGSNYSPLFLDPLTYQQIIGSSSDSGGSGGKGGRNGGRK